MAQQPSIEEILAQYGLFLSTGEGVNPFGLTPADVPIPFLPPASDKDIGTQDYFNDRLTFEKKGNDFFMDPATTIRLGLTTGGISPESMQPKVTYTPVKAPGFQQLAMYEGSNNPVLVIMADVFKNKGTALDAESAVLAAMRNPDHPFYEQLNADEAIHYDNNGVRSADRSRIQKIASQIEKNVIGDPTFNAIDPMTGLPANAVDENGNLVPVSGSAAGFDTSGAGFTDGEIVSGNGRNDGQYVQGADGNWYLRSETPSATREALDEAGFTGDPFATYSPDIIARPGDLEREYAAFEAVPAAQELLAGKRATTDEKAALVERFLKQGPVDIYKPEAVGEIPTQRVMPLRQVTRGQGRRTTMEQAEPSEADRRALPMALEQRAMDFARSNRQNVAEADARAKNQQAHNKTVSALRRQSSKAAAEQYAAQRSANNRGIEAEYAKVDQQRRRAYMEWLARQGHSPFQDWNRARQTNIYGG